MATYSYTIVDAAGKKKRGAIEAQSREEVADKLKAQGSTIVSVAEASVLNRDIEISFLQARPKPRDMAVFCRQFVSIVGAGVPVLQALTMLAQQTENRRLAKATDGCRRSIERGETLSRAMSEWPEIFPSMFITMVEAGEASGSLEVSFSRMADQFEKTAKLKGTMKKASIYPIVICLVAVAAVSILLTLVIPTFQGMLEDLGTELPGITRLVIAASDFMQDYWYIVFLALAAFIILLRTFKHTQAGSYFFDNISLHLPVVKKLVIKTASARMARTLSTLLAAGLPLMDSLEITSRTMTNIYFRDELLNAREAVSLGANLSEPLEAGRLFPPLVYHMIHIGEETGSIEGMLDKLAGYYDEEVEQATEQLMAAVEPAIILLLASIIGVIVMAVITPMASMYSGLENL